MARQTHDQLAAGLTAEEDSVVGSLRDDVHMLAVELGERTLRHRLQLEEAARFIERSLRETGAAVHLQEYPVRDTTCANIEAVIPGRSPGRGTIILGAHYDTVVDCPGANDNASGVASILELARRHAGQPGSLTLRLVAYCTEEPPFFGTESMGSLVHARECRDRVEPVVGMASLDSIAYYSDEPGSQTYPVPGATLLYPDRADFLGFVGNLASGRFLRSFLRAYRRHARVPVEKFVWPTWVPGIDSSDQWAYSRVGYPAFEITDTAYLRHREYHLRGDSAEKLDYVRHALVTLDIHRALVDLLD